MRIKILFIIFLMSFFFKDNTSLKIEEEAQPIRNYNTIVGMSYSISFSNARDKVLLKPKVIESIYHYKESISLPFVINIIIYNKTKKDYVLREVDICRDKKVLKKYNYSYKINSFQKKELLFDVSKYRYLQFCRDCYMELKIIR